MRFAMHGRTDVRRWHTTSVLGLGLGFPKRPEMTLDRRGNAMLLAFRRALPLAISAHLGNARLIEAIAQAQAQGWTDADWLARISVADTHGLQPGPAAAKILSQLEAAVKHPCPDRTPGPPPAAQVLAEHASQPARPEAVQAAMAAMRATVLRRPDAA